MDTAVRRRADNAGENIPGELFKYVSLNKFEVLADGYLWFSNPFEFNDPFDMVPQYAGMTYKSELLPHVRAEVLESKIMRSMKEQPRNVRRELQRKLEKKLSDGYHDRMSKEKDSHSAQLFSEIGKSIGVACFSEIHNSLLMWAHYARDHTGVVVAFNRNAPAFIKFRPIQKVSYGKDRPIFRSGSEQTIEIFLRKSVEWSYEREWRMFASMEGCEKYKDSKLKVLPVAPSAISRIYVGCRAEAETIKRVKIFAREHKIRLIQMIPSSTGYFLDEKEIPQETR